MFLDSVAKADEELKGGSFFLLDMDKAFKGEAEWGPEAIWKAADSSFVFDLAVLPEVKTFLGCEVVAQDVLEVIIRNLTVSV